MGALFNTTVVIKDVDVEVEVEYTPGTSVPARSHGHPDNWTPDESEAAEVHAVRAVKKDGKAGKDVTRKLDDRAMERLRDEAWEAGMAARSDPRDDYEPDDCDDYRGP